MYVCGCGYTFNCLLTTSGGRSASFSARPFWLSISYLVITHSPGIVHITWGDIPITKNAKNTISVAYPPHIHQISITQSINYPRGYLASHQRHHNQQIIPSRLPHQPQPCIQSQRDRDRRQAKENDSHGQGIHPAGMN